MRHLRKGRKFSRTRKLRRALLRNLGAAFFKKGRIVTSEAKAKELRPFVEEVINTAKSQTIAARRNIAKKLPAEAVIKVMSETAKGYQERHGGYTRIVKLGKRKRDAAPMAILELVDANT